MKYQCMLKNLKAKMIAVFIGLIAIIMTLLLLMNSFMLEPFYQFHKKGKLIDAYHEINNVEDITSHFSADIQKISFRDNLSIMVVSPNFEILNSTDKEERNLVGRLFGYYTGLFHGEVKVQHQTDQYIIQQSEDRAVKLKYLEMWGQLDSGNYFIIRTPLESIQQSAGVTNIFLLGIGILTIIAAVSLAVVFAKRLTRPIVELTEISKRMASLDFDAKYEGRSGDEFDILGENFNRMSMELERTISELKTANNELQKDIERKIRVDEMRIEFLNNVSHELKTPIALIQGYAEGLHDNINDDEESREFYCEVIQDEAGKMNRMVQKLMTLNQLEFGNEQVVMERFDIIMLIREIIHSMNILIQQKEAKILFDDSKSIYVWGDEFRIEEVVTNYLSNALNHLAYSNIIDIRVVEKDGIVTTTVFNTGDPIPNEELDKIWIKFYKVDKARTREYGGSGVGLSIVKAIMESMNQKYGVRTYNNGVMFWFTLESAGAEKE